MAAPRPYIQKYWAMFGPISLFRASFDIKNEFGRSKTFRLHPSKLDFDLPELVLGGCPGIGAAVFLSALAPGTRLYIDSLFFLECIFLIESGSESYGFRKIENFFLGEGAQISKRNIFLVISFIALLVISITTLFIFYIF